MLNPDKIPDHIRRDIMANLDMEDPEEIRGLSVEAAIRAYFVWNGVIGGDRLFTEAIDAIRKAASPLNGRTVGDIEIYCVRPCFRPFHDHTSMSIEADFRYKGFDGYVFLSTDGEASAHIDIGLSISRPHQYDRDEAQAATKEVLTAIMTTDEWRPWREEVLAYLTGIINLFSGNEDYSEMFGSGGDVYSRYPDNEVTDEELEEMSRAIRRNLENQGGES